MSEHVDTPSRDRTKRKPGRSALIERIIAGLTVKVLWNLLCDWFSSN